MPTIAGYCGSAAAPASVHAIALACSKQGEHGVPRSSIADEGCLCYHSRIGCYTGWRCLTPTACAINAPATSDFARTGAGR